jgi:polysaccharide biosynthesis transport protein
MEADNTVKMADYVAVFRRRRIVMIAIALPVILIVGLVALALPSIYTSTAVFRLRDTTSAEANRASYMDQVVTSLTQYVLSDANEHELIEKYNPYPRLRDNEGAAMGRLSEDVRVKMVTGTILDPDSGHDKTINTGFEVSYDNRDPKAAFQVAGWLADAFTKGSRENALTSTTTQVQFLDDEADRVRSQIATLEDRLADFKKQNFDQLPESAQANLGVRNQTEQETTEVERDISTQQQNRIFLLQQLQTAQSTGTGANLAQLEDMYKRDQTKYDESYPDMIALRRQIESARQGGGTASTDGSLKSELASQQAILAEARLRYSDDHPDIRRLLGNIKSLEARIAAGEKTDPNATTGESAVVVQLKTQLHAIDTQLDSLQRRRQELRAKYSDLESRLSSTPRVEKDYEALNRDLGTAKTQYDQLLSQRAAGELQKAAIQAGTADKFELLAAPTLPAGPSKPKRSSIALLGFIGAIVLAVAAAMAAEATDGLVRGSRDILATLSVSPLASIPEIRNSAYKRRRAKRWVTAASGALLGIPIIFFCIRLLVR